MHNLTVNTETDIAQLKAEMTGKDAYISLKNTLLKNNWQLLTYALDMFYNEYQKVPFKATDEEIRQWCFMLPAKYNKLNTIRSYLMAMKRILNIGVALGITKHNAIKRMEELREIKIPSTAADNEVPDLQISKNKINHIITEKIPVRVKALIIFLANTGCRVSELVGLKKSDIERVRSAPCYFIIRMYEPKGNKIRTIEIPSETMDWVMANINKSSRFRKNAKYNEGEYFMQNERGEKMTTNGVRWILKYYWKKHFNEDKISPHKFRHWLITEKVLVEKVPIAEVSKLIGHANINTTMRYTHVKRDVGFYDTIKTPDMTEKPDVIIIDKTAEILAEILSEDKPKGV